MWYELQYKKGFFRKKWWTDHVTQNPKEALEYISGSANKKITINDIYNLKVNEILYSKFWYKTLFTKIEPIRRIVVYNSKPEHKHI